MGGGGKIRRPFRKWGTKTYRKLDWYNAYNQVKHNMIDNYNMATLDNLVEAFSALHIIMCAQFYDISIVNPKDLNNPSLMGDFPSFEDKPYISTITGNFLIKIPRDKDWKDNDKYSFDWNDIKGDVEPFNKYPYKPPIKNRNYCQNSKVIN